MANRILRDCTSSTKVDALSDMAERFFYRLMMKVDDYGCHPAIPKLLNGVLFPLKNYTDAKIASWLDELEREDLVMVYEIKGLKYLQIKGFDQKLRRMKHTFPPPTDGQMTDSRQTSDGQVTDKRRPDTETDTETDTEGKEKTREWFVGCIDSLFLEQLKMTHQGKNVDQAIAEAWTFLAANKLRLKNSDASDVKKLVNTWLGNMKPQNIKPKVSVKQFLADA